METPAVSLLLTVSLFYTAALLQSIIVRAQGGTAQGASVANRNMVLLGQDNQCRDKLAAIQRRQEQIDTRMNGFDTRVNRIDSRLDGIETAISDMKEYVQTRMEAMDRKVELGLMGIGHRPQRHPGDVNEVSYIIPLVQGDFRPIRTPEVHRSCEDALNNGWTTSGIYRISLGNNVSMDVFCEQQLDGGGWTVFQVRKDGSVNFYRDWNWYKQGFGELMGEFWLGNTNIHLLTKHRDQELKVELVSAEGDLQYADYSHFSIGDEADKYRLNVTGYYGGTPPGDSLSHQNGAYFSTKDRDHDTYKTSCAVVYRGAWWYKKCHYSNLNGLYNSKDYAKGLTWYHWKGYQSSMKATRMMIRKRN